MLRARSVTTTVEVAKVSVHVSCVLLLVVAGDNVVLEKSGAPVVLRETGSSDVE
jgi:hypothetical protein